MSFLNQTNVARVNKITEIITLLKKSAVSNKSTEKEIWDVVEPAIQALADLCDTETPKAPEPSVPDENKEGFLGRQAVTPPKWASIRQMAEEVDLADLTVAMAVYLNRIDEHLNP